MPSHIHSPLPIPYSLLAFFALSAFFASTAICIAARSPVTSSWQKRPPEKDFEIIEGVFHDGLGTFAELSLANRLIAIARISQQPFDLSRSEAKMRDAINRLPEGQRSRAVFERERANIASAVDRGAALLLDRAKPASLARVRHTAKEFAGAKAADLRLEFDDGSIRPISVKTEKSNKVAVAEGQTPDIGAKWSGRYFRISDSELEAMARESGFATMAELKSNYLSVDIDRLTSERISFRPSRPRGGQPVASEFGIKIDGRVVVTFQIKHRRGSARGTARQFEFSDITTRLMI